MRILSSRFISALFFCSIFSFAFCLLYSVSASAKTVDEVVKQLQERYDSTTGFRADFTQEVESATLGQKVESRGKVFFKKPGRMLWEFSEPKQTLVSDGKFFWFYQPAENQVIKTPFQQTFSSTTPASFLLGVGRLTQDFTIALKGETTEVYSLRLTPKKDPEAVGFLDFEVSTKTFDILQASVTDPLGNITRLRFSNIDRTASPEDSLFRFTTPPGVDVVEPIPAS